MLALIILTQSILNVACSKVVKLVWLTVQVQYYRWSSSSPLPSLVSDWVVADDGAAVDEPMKVVFAAACAKAVVGMGEGGGVMLANWMQCQRIDGRRKSAPDMYAGGEQYIIM